MGRSRYNIPGEYKIMSMRKGKIDRFWIRTMVDACREYDKKRSETLRKVSNRDSSSED